MRQIEIKTTRVRQHVIRRELEFREGDILTPDQIEESRANLFRLGLLKALAIRPEWDDALDGYRVRVEGEDGWFVLPWPMVASRGGEPFASLTLIEHNYFRECERIIPSVTYSDGAVSGMLSLSVPHHFFFGGSFSSSGTEYLYEDGAYSAKDFEGSFDDEQPADLGAIANSYDKSQNRSFIFVGVPLRGHWKAALGLTSVRASYEDALASEPADEGDVNSWGLTLSHGKGGAGMMRGGFMNNFGRMFGLGMAEVQDSFKPLPKSETKRDYRLSIEHGTALVGSDAEFFVAHAVASQATLFRNRQSLNVAVNGAWGSDLPACHKLTTGGLYGLRGVYAREYRGDRLLTLHTSYYAPFFRSKLGVLNTEAFAEYGAVWQESGDGAKQGLGISLSYQFWRFPLPLGMACTYSLDDNNVQASFAIGGTF